MLGGALGCLAATVAAEIGGIAKFIIIGSTVFIFCKFI